MDDSELPFALVVFVSRATVDEVVVVVVDGDDDDDDDEGAERLSTHLNNVISSNVNIVIDLSENSILLGKKISDLISEIF